METVPQTRSSLTSLLSQSIVDIPAWARAALVLFGLGGVVVIVVASLMGRQEQTIAVDKLLHFGGYATLSLIFVVGLRPALFLPAILLLGMISIAMEYLQPLNQRTFDPRDMVFNLVGLCVGFVLGLLFRIAGRVALTSIRHRQLSKFRRNYSPGAVILREGSPVQKFYVIEKGQVQLTREVDQQRKVLGTVGPGDMFGLLGVLQSQPQYSTVEALQPTTVLCLDMETLAGKSGTAPEPLQFVWKAMARQIQSLADKVVEAEKVMM